VRASGIGLVTLTAVATGVTYADHAPLIPLVAAEFGLDDLAAGLLSTALFVSFFLATLPTSHFADRLGPKRVVAAGVAFGLAGSVLFAVAPSYPIALAAKALDGIGAALAFPSGARYIAGLYTDARSHVGLGLFGAGYPLGSAAALLVLPGLASRFGWREAFVVSSAFIALAFVLWLAAPSVPPVARTGTMRDALRCANCWLAALQHAAGIGVALASGTWITVYLLREFSLPLALSGVLGSLLLILAVFARPLGGVMITRGVLGTTAVMRVGDLAIVAGVAFLALPGRPLPLSLCGALLVGVGAGLPYAAVFTTADASLPAAPGAAQGLAAVGGTAGVMIGAPVMGYAVQTSGFGAAWLFVGLVAALALVGTFAMRGEEELRGRA
jgi:predicted MFS family arabinose efflux permease